MGKVGGYCIYSNLLHVRVVVCVVQCWVYVCRLNKDEHYQQWSRTEMHLSTNEKIGYWFQSKNYYRALLVLFLWCFTQVASTVIQFLRCLPIGKQM